MSERHRGIRTLPISAELLRQVLKLPDDVTIADATFDFQSPDTLLLRIESAQFTAVPAGHIVPRTDATYLSERLPCGCDQVTFQRFVP